MRLIVAIVVAVLLCGLALLVTSFDLNPGAGCPDGCIERSPTPVVP